MQVNKNTDDVIFVISRLPQSRTQDVENKETEKSFKTVSWWRWENLAPKKNTGTAFLNSDISKLTFIWNGKEATFLLRLQIYRPSKERGSCKKFPTWIGSVKLVPESFGLLWANDGWCSTNCKLVKNRCSGVYVIKSVTASMLAMPS